MNDCFSQKLIYLDAEFVSRLYEERFKVATPTQITRTDSLEASASIPFFSGGGSSSESRTYSVSTIAMLKELDKLLKEFPVFGDTSFSIGRPSQICWIFGALEISKLEVTRTRRIVQVFGQPDPEKNKPETTFVGEETYFAIESSGVRFALSTTDQYFSSGLAGLKGLSALVIDHLALPCSALVRVLSANTSHGHWVAVPLVITDRHGS